MELAFQREDGWFESFQRLLSQFCIVEQCWREFARPFHIKWRYENVRSRGAMADCWNSLQQQPQLRFRVLSQQR